MLLQAFIAAEGGDYGRARALLAEAERLDIPSNSPWFEGSVRLLGLELTLTDGVLTEGDLAEAESELHFALYRRNLAYFWYQLYLRGEQYERALVAAYEHERLARNAGRETTTAWSAFPLARLGRRDEASSAVKDTVARLTRLHPAPRPHWALARALWELERPEEAASHGLQAYRQAWGDGPSHYASWSNLQDIAEFLQQMGVPLPELPTVDPATVVIPLESEVHALIATLEAQGPNP